MSRSKFLIVGEQDKEGERTFERSRSGERLRYWFSVADYDELLSIADLTNVFTLDGARRDINRMIATVKYTVLVGQKAQARYGIRDPSPLWATCTLMGLPHPSGLNRQLNSLADDAIRDYVGTVLTVWGYR